MVGKWQLIERTGLRRPPIGNYRFAQEVTAESVRDAALVIAETQADANALKALGFEVEKHRGAPGEFPFDALTAAIRTQNLMALRERYGDYVYLGRPGE